MDEAERQQRAERHIARIQRDDEKRIAHAHLPDGVELDDARAIEIVDRYLSILDRYRGKVVAPLSSLPDNPPRIAQALAQAAMTSSDPRPIAEMFVDLQSFRREEDWQLLNDPPIGDDGSKERSDAAERLLAARAAATALLREDVSVVGDMNALRAVDDLTIGEGRRALAAVESYRRAQFSGFMAIVAWPLGVIVGAIAGIIFIRLSLVAVALSSILVASTFVVAPFYGWVVGRMGAALDNAAMRTESQPLAVSTRLIADIGTLALLFGGPLLFGFVPATIAESLALP